MKTEQDEDGNKQKMRNVTRVETLEWWCVLRQVGNLFLALYVEIFTLSIQIKIAFEINLYVKDGKKQTNLF